MLEGKITLMVRTLRTVNCWRPSESETTFSGIQNTTVSFFSLTWSAADYTLLVVWLAAYARQSSSQPHSLRIPSNQRDIIWWGSHKLPGSYHTLGLTDCMSHLVSNGNNYKYQSRKIRWLHISFMTQYDLKKAISIPPSSPFISILNLTWEVPGNRNNLFRVKNLHKMISHSEKVLDYCLS